MVRLGPNAQIDNIPKPPTKSPVELILGPVEKTAQDWLLKFLNRFFGVRAIRAYITVFLLSYLSSSIEQEGYSLKFQIIDLTEFSLVISVFSFIIAILTLLDIKEMRFWEQQAEKNRVWRNYLENIQDMIQDPEKRMQVIYTILYGNDPKAIQDWIIKSLGPDIRQLKEELASLSIRIEPIEQVFDEALRKRRERSG